MNASLKKSWPLLLAGAGVVAYLVVSSQAKQKRNAQINALANDVIANNWTPAARDGFLSTLMQLSSEELQQMYVLLHQHHFANMPLPAEDPLWLVWQDLRNRYPSFWPK